MNRDVKDDVVTLLMLLGGRVFAERPLHLWPQAKSLLDNCVSNGASVLDHSMMETLKEAQESCLVDMKYYV